MQVGRDLHAVLRGVRRLTPSATRTVVDADPGVSRHRRSDPPERRRHPAGARDEHDRGTARPGTVQVQAVPTDVDQPTGHRVRPGIRRLPDGLVATTDGRQPQQCDHRVEQPSPNPAPQLPADPDDHPDRQRQHDRGPHPVEHPVRRRAEPHQQQPAQPHDQRRNHSPPLRLISKPHRPPSQQRPAHRETAEHPAGDATLRRRNERRRHQQQSSDEPGGHRTGHDPADVSPRPGASR